MNRLAFIAFIMVYSTIYSFSNDTIVNYYSNGIIKEVFLGEVNKNDTLRLGFYEFYNSEGNIIQKGAYINNELNGFFEVFYKNGRSKIKSNYVIGKKDGLYQLFDIYGNLRQQINFKNDLLDGDFIQYDFQGNIERKTHYCLDKKIGIELIYNKYNHVQSRIEYKADTINGLYETFYDDGN